MKRGHKGNEYRVGIILDRSTQKNTTGMGSTWTRHPLQQRTREEIMNIVQVHAPTNEATDEEKDLFYDRLQDILPARNDVPIKPEPSSKEEIAKAINALKANKAAGPDLIPPEALKADIPTTVDILYGLFVNIKEQDKVPCD
ncbi:hypothetical protein ElyMa_004340200 [Elysia marginata]|uniref:Reverse transcriptase domain-containing protein n=1 Tax=Elysia marginata TaxID=1093978 RepID=A0AAV4H302_9GAST|nr:hypothetical protein ElyMa_004340200 [Elysia marginata]